MSRFWSPVVHDLTPYVPGEQPKLAKLVKLNTNENPYPPSPRALEAIRAELGEDADRLKLYPDPTGSQLKAAVARHFDVPAEWVFVGNSSDEVLAHTFQALLKHDAPLLFPDITYSFYPVYCGLYGIDFEAIPLDAQFAIQVDDYLARGAGQVGAVIFPNPNAPTGRLLPLADIARLAEALPDAPIVIDEAYVDFGGLDVIPTAVALIRRHPNILVTQTLSKSRSLAGLRVGFAIGQPELIEALTRVKDSFQLLPAGPAGPGGRQRRHGRRGLVRHHPPPGHRQPQCPVGQPGRAGLRRAAVGCQLRLRPSPPAGRDAALAAALRERSIIVRHFKAERIDQFLRITVGTDSQCDLLIDALRDILA
jgi:histidinol-phosphate aminotransferase